LSQGK
jgi:hypothetical protein